MRGKKFFLITLIEIAIIAFILIDLRVFSQAPAEERLANWQTEANLPVIGKNEEYDVVMLGTSHGRIFSRFKNHERVEKVLDKKIINLSQGSERGGARNQQIYLKYFYERDNTAKTLVYFVDPFIFYRKSLDANERNYLNEPYRKDFKQLLERNNTDRKIIDFYANKEKEGIQPQQYPDLNKDVQEGKVASIEGQMINDRVNFLYQDPYSEEDFKAVLATIIQTIELAKNRDTRVIVIVPTTLLPEQLGDKYVLDVLAEEGKKGTFEYYDYSNVITDPALYYDTDHLNTEGILHFSEKYLKPILDKQTSQK